MKRFFSFVLVLLIIFITPFQLLAQSSRYRLKTQYNPTENPAAPSFRATDGQFTRIPERANQQNMLGVEGSIGQAAAESSLLVGYQVHLLGEVVEPGTYKINASERLSEVIKRAGGLSENGSERNVELRRKGRSVVYVDLLDFKLFGNLDNNPYLTDNDVVFVPLRNNVIQVVGAVKRPGIYEIKNERTLEDVVKLVGGFSVATSTKETIKVVRFEEDLKVVHEVAINDTAMREFDIFNGDVVIVPNVITKNTQFDYNIASLPGDQVFYPSYEDRVFVLGGVAAPGAYPFSPYYSISQYISLAGGITDRGSPHYKLVSMDGNVRKGSGGMHANPGDTIMVKQHWMSPASWVGFIMGIASFGLSTTATVLALTKR